MKNYPKNDGPDFYPITLRFVRFHISDDSMETLVTNLDEASFPVKELKQLYHLRWDIETSFRQLKYTSGEHYPGDFCKTYYVQLL